MPRELLVFRHGKSDWGTDAADDFDRPLAQRGRKAVKRMALWAREQDVLPHRIVSSTAERARQTTLRFCRHGDIPDSAVAWTDAIYEAGVATLLTVLAEMDPGCDRLMIVGHNPGFESLVEYLTGRPIQVPPGTPAFPTAALARLAMPDDWARLERGCADLLTLLRPRELDS